MPTAAETRQALERADRLVTLAPERGRRTYANTACIEAGTLCQVEDKGHRFAIDAGKGLGGGDEAPTPSALLRCALSSCIAIGVKLWAARREVPVLHGDTPATLAARVLEAEHRLLPEVVLAAIEGRIRVDGGRAWIEEPAPR